MRLPKRADTHIIESESFRLLQQLAPEQWIIREVSERDYGIDCYIEICTKDGHLTGDLVSVQLKGMRGLEWKKDGEFKKTRTPQIKTSTVNYWHNLPVPVFIFVADLKIKDIFFMSVGHSIRNNYQKLTNQKTMSFRLLNKCNLSSQDGLEVFEFMYLFESSYEDLIPYIIGLLTRIDEFVDFIKQYQGLDQFLELELPEHLLFRTIYESCCRAEAYFRLEQSLPPLRDIYNKDVQDWGESYGTLHYGTVDYSLNILSSVFPAIIKRSMKMITDEQAYYWMRTDPFLFKVCTSGEMDWSLQRTENLP